MTNTTLQYYNTNADSFIDNTFNADVSTDIHNFIKKVKSGGKILDVGCGSGRDALIFKNLGFNVTAFDVSEELVKKASGYFVKLTCFEYIKPSVFSNTLKKDIGLDFGIKDSIILTKNEKNKIAKLFFENYIDTIKSETHIMNKEGLLIMPDMGRNSIKINNTLISINGLSDSLKVDEIGKNVLRFKEKTFEILKQNNNFNKIMNEIKSKPDDRLFL